MVFVTSFSLMAESSCHPRTSTLCSVRTVRRLQMPGIQPWFCSNDLHSASRRDRECKVLHRRPSQSSPQGPEWQMHLPSRERNACSQFGLILSVRRVICVSCCHGQSVFGVATEPISQSKVAPSRRAATTMRLSLEITTQAIGTSLPSLSGPRSSAIRFPVWRS